MGWCLMLTVAIFQLYCSMSTSYIYKVKTANVDTYIRHSPVLKDHLFLVLS